MRVFVILTICGLLIFETHGASICKPQEGHCTGKDCNREQICENGICNPDGSCLCNPCFTGDTCQKFADENYPYFLKKEETIFVDASHEGLIYQAYAQDDDRYKTCLPESTFPCPCAKVYYELFDKTGESETIFSLNSETGEVRIRDGLKFTPGENYILEIAVSNYNENSPYKDDVLSIDILTLNVHVQESNSLEDFLINSEDNEIEDEYEVEMNEDINDEDFGRRVKRKAFSDNIDLTNITLTMLNTPTEPLRAGMSIDFELKIILTEIPSGSPMALKVELYVMDTLTGITTFALCGVTIQDIGASANKIMKEDGSPLTIEDIPITMNPNKDFPNINDQTTLDFGKIYNTDTAGAADNYDSSTILITFTAVMLSNTDYQNETGIVTAGVEYKDSNIVWVSQASFDYDSAEVATYPADVSIEGPDEIPEKGAGYFEIDATIVQQYADIELEIYTPMNIEDQFSISSLMLIEKGANHACMEESETISFEKSVSGETYHRAKMSFPVFVKGLDYSDLLASETSDTGNLVKIGFTILGHEALEGETISVAVGIKIGTKTIFTGFANITIGAALAASETAASTLLSMYALDDRTDPPTVGPGQTATHALEIGLHDETTATVITCTATPGATNKICGIKYGKSGKYAASFPDLLEAVTYNDDGSAEFTIKVLSGASSVARVAAQEFITLEVTTVFNDPASPTTVTCDGMTIPPLTAQAGGEGVTDLSGVSIKIGNDNTWYAGSQAGILTTLTFPANGAPYGQMIYESSSDFFETNFGSEVCEVKVTHIGRGAACLSKVASDLSNAAILKTGLDTSPYNDSVEVDFGAICGSYLKNPQPDDMTVSIRTVYTMPIPQDGLVDSTFNLSLGVMLDNKTIWTGWGDYSVIVDWPVSIDDEAKPPMFTVVPPSLLEEEQNRPFLIKILIKTHPGSVGRYIISAVSEDTTVVQICKIIFLNLGDSYACIDKKPYGKHLDPTQVVKLVHDSNQWGKSAELDLGVVRNLGIDEIYPTPIGDKDTMELAVIAKGVDVGTGTITVKYTDGRTTNLAEIADVPVAMTITTHTPLSTDPVLFNITGFNDTMEYFEDVMKEINVDLHIPKDYDKKAVIKIFNPNALELVLCYVAVAWAGVNIPCLIPSELNSTREAGDGVNEENLVLDLQAICYMAIDKVNWTENVVNVRVGVMPAKEVSAATFYVRYYENGATTPTEEHQVDITKSADAFVPESTVSSEVEIYDIDNGTEITVEPGQRIYIGALLKVPPFVTAPVELGVMTSTSNGHAYATVHGFKYGETVGKNIGCPSDNIDLYDYELLQNASTDAVPMIHESQTDTLIADLKYLTNTGISYLHMVPQMEDDLVSIEADILIADHEGLADGDLITISFAVKVGTTIVVMEKNVTLSRPASPVMVLMQEFNFTDPSHNEETIFVLGDKIGFTGRIQHVLNESQVEAYDARIRVILPSYVRFANDSYTNLAASATADTASINITSVFTAPNFLEFEIMYLFFTDIVEFNVTVTVDPYEDMPKGLEILNSTALLRFVYRGGSMSAAAAYYRPTLFLNYVVQGSDCYEPLLVTPTACQFKASSAIDASFSADKAVTATGWSPAVRDTNTWKHHISVDFLKKTRITQIDFMTIAGRRTIVNFKLQYSTNGIMFLDVCSDILTAGELPSQCKIVTRYARILILSLDSTDEGVAIGVHFAWKGCPVGLVDGACTWTEPSTKYADDPATYRHAAYDTGNDIAYLCDEKPPEERLYCHASADGSTWNPLPSYVARLAGYDTATNKMYAKDSKDEAYVASEDGINWNLVDDTEVASLSLTPPQVIPGNDRASLTDVTVGGDWIADFDGLKKGASYKVKWSSCCS